MTIKQKADSFTTVNMAKGMTIPTTPQESQEELMEKVRQELYVNLDPIAGDEALDNLISSERQRLLGEVRELVEKQRLTGFHGSLSRDNQEDGLRLHSYNRAIDDLLNALSQLEGEK